MKIPEVSHADTYGDYTDSFGFQWNRFRKTQIDRFNSGIDISRLRFLSVTGWDEENLRGNKILEVGSGAGRFTQIALETTEAEIFSVDSSDAVLANAQNNGPHPRLHIQKASVYELPFEPRSFDKVFCFGMLQHTPDPRKTVQCLVDMLKPGGELIIDFYPYKGWYTKIHAKYMLRPFTRKMDPQQLLKWIENNIAWMIRVYKALHKLKMGVFARFLPLVDIYRVLPEGLSPLQEREWAILDTLDMLSPEFDKPQKSKDIIEWLKMSGVEVSFAGNVEYSKDHIVNVVKGIIRCAE